MTTMKHQLCAWALIASSASWAHDGHGPVGTHWHATDAWGFGLALAAAATALWWRGRQ
jgi:hypothetical protein